MMKGDPNSDDKDGGVASCRISVDAMQSLEEKLRALEHFLRARRNQRRGHYGRIFGVGDMPGFFSGGSLESVSKNLFDAPRGPIMQAPTPKRQRVPYSPAELSVMEVGDLFHTLRVCIL
jgi:nuclear pore complex protein Nup155